MRSPAWRRSPRDPRHLFAWWHGHWGLGNRLHYVRGVSMGEDASRTGSGAVPQIMSAFRNTAMCYLRCRGASNIAEELRRNAAQVRPLLLARYCEKMIGPASTLLTIDSHTCQFKSASPDQRCL
jgi:hypothetical protein